jgi:hypothetical protein
MIFFSCFFFLLLFFCFVFELCVIALLTLHVFTPGNKSCTSCNGGCVKVSTAGLCASCQSSCSERKTCTDCVGDNGVVSSSSLRQCFWNPSLGACSATASSSSIVAESKCGVPCEAYKNNCSGCNSNSMCTWCESASGLTFSFFGVLLFSSP